MMSERMNQLEEKVEELEKECKSQKEIIGSIILGLVEALSSLNRVLSKYLVQ